MEEIERRTIYAAERTMLAWIRTGLALMGFGFVLARFSLLLKQLSAMKSYGNLETPGFSLWIGIALVGLGALVNARAGITCANDLKRLHGVTAFVPPMWIMGRAVSLTLTIIGLAMMVYLVTIS
jgi:putative membrane protein